MGNDVQVPSCFGSRSYNLLNQLGNLGAANDVRAAEVRGFEALQRTQLKDGHGEAREMLRGVDHTLPSHDQVQIGGGKVSFDAQPVDGGVVNLNRMRALFA